MSESSDKHFIKFTMNFYPCKSFEGFLERINMKEAVVNIETLENSIIKNYIPKSVILQIIDDKKDKKLIINAMVERVEKKENSENDFLVTLRLNNVPEEIHHFIS